MRRLWTRSFPWTLVVAGVLLLGLAAGFWLRPPARRSSPAPPPENETELTPVSHAQAPAETFTLRFPADMWEAAGLEMEAVREAPLERTVELTGKIALNEDRVAHIFPLVEGRVDEVKIRLGDKVRKGDLLVVVQSTEVGRSMLQLFQDRMEHQFAETKDRWTQTVAANTQLMIDLIREEASIDEIEQQLTDRPLGAYRDKLMTAYVDYDKARKTLDRLRPLSEAGTITGRQLLEAESDWNGARATLQSLLEQFQQEAQQSAILSAQNVKELETRVAVDETNLKIIGFDEESLQGIDPVRQGETISHYPIHSPFDGTIISKDVVLLERVGPESQILSIADLSSVWVTTDIFEENLPLLEQLDEQTIRFRSPAWPDQVFEARIFYSGDLVDESSRTVSMRAIADNTQGHLKPGMFVNVELPGGAREHVPQVPLTAIQEHQGESFVFVHVKDDVFERRTVTTGIRDGQHVEIRSGLKAGDEVVARGGFALKSQMLSELLAE